MSNVAKFGLQVVNRSLVWAKASFLLHDGAATKTAIEHGPC